MSPVDLGPLPEPEYIYSDKCSDEYETYCRADILEERERCYELGIAAGRAEMLQEITRLRELLEAAVEDGLAAAKTKT